MADLRLLVETVAPPPMNSLVPAPTEINNIKRIIQLRWRLKDSLEGFEGDLVRLKEEGNLLSQVLYKIHNRFHNDPGYRDLRMLEKSTKKLLSHNFLRSTNTFLSYLPSSTSASQAPTRLMARHAALQLYGAAALLNRVVTLCSLSGVSAFQRISLGHFWGVAAHQLGMVGRLWSIAKHLVAAVKEAYSHMRALVSLLSGDDVGEPLLPQTLESFLPEHTARDTISNTDMQVSTTADVQPSLESFLDLGVPVRRSLKAKVESGTQGKEKEEPSEIKTTVQIEHQKKTIDSFSEIHSLEQLGIFLKQETKLRKVSKKTCVTSKLKQDEWKTLKAEVLKSMNPKLPNKSLKQCRKILRGALA